MLGGEQLRTLEDTEILNDNCSDAKPCSTKVLENQTLQTGLYDKSQSAMENICWKLLFELIPLGVAAYWLQ